MSQRNWQYRQRCTVIAPNGARVTFRRVGLMYDALLRWAYEPMLGELAAIETKFDVFKRLPGKVDVEPAYGLGPYIPVRIATGRARRESPDDDLTTLRDAERQRIVEGLLARDSYTATITSLSRTDA